MECLVFDWGEPAEGVLAASTVVGVLDPDDDREPELFAGAPAAAVQDVLLQQREEVLHGGVVGAGTNPAHRPALAGVAQGPDVGVGPELTAAVGVHHGVDPAA